MKQKIIILALLFVTLQAYAQIYTYDANNKLTKVEYGNGVTVSYEYDVLGNRISKTVSGVTAQSFKVTVKASPKEYGSVDGGGTYSEGANVELNAVASVGFEFEKWSDGPTDNPRTITVTKDVSYTALFKVKEKSQEESGGEIGPGGVDLGIYDTNGDGVVNQYDLDAIIDAYLEDAPATPSTDLDDDGEITIADISMMVAIMNDMHTGEYNGHEYVDLGLPSGTLWATCNLGATSSEESGCYYAWGETTGSCEGKTDFSWRNYKYCNGLIGEGLTKYNNDPELGYEGYTDDLETLEPADDAATANWGGKWRMPTRQEINELRNKNYTKWTFATHNGVKGFVITSIVKGYVGNSIFLPAEGGFYHGRSLDYKGEYSYYWASTAFLNSYGDYAKSIVLRASGTHGDGFRYRCEGLSIRPVVNLGEIATGSDPDLSNGLVAYYPFNGNANDESGHGNHGTPMSSVTLTTGVNGDANSAYKFGGCDNPGNIHIPNSESLIIDDSWSFATFVKPTSYTGMDGWGRKSTTDGMHAIMGKDHDQSGFSIQYRLNSDSLHVWLGCTSGWTKDFGASIYGNFLNQWVHVSITYSNSTFKVYLNGQKRAEAKIQANFSVANTKDLYLGKYRDSWYPMDGVLDEVRIYNRALSDDEITQLAGEVNLNCPVAEAIDLGLPSGTKWASWNVGASSPEDCGGYYAWGETEEKDYYDWSTYTHCDGTLETCHHIGDNIAGTEYDVARMKWGDSWTMPSTDQIKELMDNCERTWTSQNGTNGMLFTGPNGNSIFLPAAGWRTYDDLIAKRENGDYWSSELNKHHEYCADGMGFDDVNNLGWTDSKLFHGGSVRAVTVSRKGESYAVYNAGTLTFYHDQLKESREGSVYELNTGRKVPGWRYYHDDITKVVFDKSFANARPTSTYRWFREMQNLTDIEGIEYLNTAEVTDMSSMFNGCKNLTYLDVSKFNTGKVTNMFSMFSSCNNLTFLDVSKFITSNVTDMSSMFYYCCSLTSLDVSKFNTEKVTDMGLMFYYCYGLTSLDVSKFNTSNVTDMSYMFSGCSKLTSLDVSNFKTEKVTTMKTMFQDCVYLTSLDVSNFNTSNVTDMSFMFNNCIRLFALDVSDFNTENVTAMEAMFQLCYSIKTLDVSNFNMASCEKSGSMFRNCQGLITLAVSSTMENLDENACESVGYYEPCTFIAPNGFNYGVDTSGESFTWKSGKFKLGGDNPSVSYINCPDDHHPHAIDLGLPSGTKWACCNVDTTHPENQSPTSYGSYYAWGEIEEKDVYDWSTYKYSNGSSHNITKYCVVSLFGDNGFTDGLTELLPEDDAATVYWGAPWHMPTTEQLDELIENCTREWAQLNGVNGTLVIGPNGNTIFLPATGFRWDDLIYYDGFSGAYWASSLLPYHEGAASYLHFDSGSWDSSGHNRSSGRAVRAVCP